MTKLDCPDCGVPPGELHNENCDVDRCPFCGRQLLMCGTDRKCPEPTEEDLIPWSGVWPGIEECVEFGWFCKPGKTGWEPCSADDPKAEADLNRLAADGIWDKDAKRFRMRRRKWKSQPIK